MANIEKVVKGIECCMRVICPINNDCPYYRTSDSKQTCREHLVADALKLLKEQKEQIETLKENFAHLSATIAVQRYDGER